MLVIRELFIHGFQQHFIVHFSDGDARFIHDGDDSFVRRFDQVADDLVVEVLDVRPCNALSLVLLLFLLQNEFDEELLKFLVTIIDA